jgi:hypothetical protein
MSVPKPVCPNTATAAPSARRGPRRQARQRSSRSRTAMSGHIVFGSNNFRSPSICLVGIMDRSGCLRADNPIMADCKARCLARSWPVRLPWTAGAPTWYSPMTRMCAPKWLSAPARGDGLDVLGGCRLAQRGSRVEPAAPGQSARLGEDQRTRLPRPSRASRSRPDYHPRRNACRPRPVAAPARPEPHRRAGSRMTSTVRTPDPDDSSVHGGREGRGLTAPRAPSRPGWTASPACLRTRSYACRPQAGAWIATPRPPTSGPTQVPAYGGPEGSVRRADARLPRQPGQPPMMPGALVR